MELRFQWQDRWSLFALVKDRQTFVFSLLILLLSLGFACGVESSTALLISRVGTEPLFYVYLGSSLLTFSLAGLTYLLVDRFPRKWVLFLSFEFFSACVFLLWFYLRTEPSPIWPYSIARIFFYAVFSLTMLEFWLLASDSFTNFEAKLRYPIFVAASVAGMMGGSFLIQQFAETVKAVNFFPLWGLLLALSPFLLFTLKSPSRLTFDQEEVTEKIIIALPPSTRRLLNMLLVFWMAYTFFAYGTDYFFNSAALRVIPNENLLAAFFGKVGFLSLAAVFFYEIFFATRTTMILGVDRSVTILCLLFFFGIGMVYFFPSLGTVSFAEGLLGYFVDFAAIALLEPVTNIFPDQLRGRMKVIIDGFGRPAGALVLLVAALIVSWKGGIDTMKEILFGAAAAFLLYPVFFRRAYLRYLLDCLESPDQKLVVNAIEALGERGKKSLAPRLLNLLESVEAIPVKKSLVLSLGRIGSEKALPKVIKQFSVPAESLQLAVLESLSLYRNNESLFALYGLMKSQENVSFQVRMNATFLMTRLVGKQMIPLLTEALRDEDLRIRANAIESLALLKSPEIIPLVLPSLHHPNRRLQANAAIALYPFRKTQKQAKERIEKLFRSKDPLNQFAGIYAIGELGLGEYRKALIDLIGHSDPRYAQKVITALARMRIPEYSAKFVDLLLDPDEGLALESIGNLDRFPKSSRWLIFEIISRLPRAERKKVISRLDQTPLDFSQEKELLATPQAVSAPRPL